MAKKWKVRCDCGKYFEEKKVSLQRIMTKAEVCPGCHKITLTHRQAKEYVRLLNLHDIIDSQKKVIKIGNSMGITLPDALRTFGVTVGKKLKIEAIDSKSFKVTL